VSGPRARSAFLAAPWASLVLAAALFGTAPAARASCGHYVQGEQAPGTQQAQQHGAPAPLPGQPCHGPTCSRHDSEPLVPPGTTHRVSPRQDPDQTATDFSAPADRSLDCLGTTGLFCPLPPVLSIYHPPR
jgi:hypothetical protein